MALADYLSAAGWMRLGQRRDDAVVRWLELNPQSELRQVSEALRRSHLATHRRLLRLEREGRVRSTLIDGPVFYSTVYDAARR